MKGKWHSRITSSQWEYLLYIIVLPSGLLGTLPTLYVFKLGGPRERALLQLLYPSTDYVPDLRTWVSSPTVACL